MSAPSSTQIHALASAAVHHAGTGCAEERTVNAMERRGWVVSIGPTLGKYAFRITDAGRRAPGVEAEIARREEARRAEQERLRAEDEARQEAERRETAAEQAAIDRALAARGLAHRNPTPRGLPAPPSFVTDRQEDALRNEVAEAFLAEVEGRSGRRPAKAIEDAYGLLIGIFDEAARVWLAAELDLLAFPQDAAWLRELSPFRSAADVVRFEAIATDLGDSIIDHALETYDGPLATATQFPIGRLRACAHCFHERTEWNLFVAARILGEFARNSHSAGEAGRLLLRLMVPRSDGRAA